MDFWQRIWRFGGQALTRAGFASTIARNSILVMAAEVAGRGINLGLSILLFRYLQPEGAGTFRFVISYGILLSIITECGITRAAVASITRDGPDSMRRTMGALTILRTGLVAAYLLLTILSFVTPMGSSLDNNTRLYILLWSVSMACQAYRRNSEAVFQGVQQFRFSAMLLVSNRLVAAAGVILAVLFHQWLPIVFLAYLLADIVECIVAALLVRSRFARPDYHGSVAATGTLLLAGLPYGLHLIAGQLYYYLDNVLIKYLAVGTPAAVEREIGYYSSVYQIVLTLIFIPITLCNTLFPPLISAHQRGDQPRLKSLFNYNFVLLLLAGTPVALFFYMFRRDLILFFYKVEYLPAVPMLAAVIWTLPLLFLSAPLSNFLAATGKQFWVTALAFGNVLFNVGLNLWLIPRLGGLGAAISTTATEAFSLITLLVAMLVFFPKVFAPGRLLAVAAAQALTTAGLCQMDGTGVLQRAAMFLVYSACCVGVLWLVIKERRNPDSI